MTTKTKQYKDMHDLIKSAQYVAKEGEKKTGAPANIMFVEMMRKQLDYYLSNKQNDQFQELLFTLTEYGINLKSYYDLGDEYKSKNKY